MKKIILLICFINLSFRLFPDDTFYYISGGNIVPAEMNSSNVEMIDEIINIQLFDDYYQVTVDFTFYNNGENENLLVGFPYLLQREGGVTTTSIYDFKTWVNGELLEHKKNSIEISEQGIFEVIINQAFTKNVFFPSKQTTKTKVEYKAEYGQASPSYKLASYYYGSGRTWYNSIGKMTINIINNISKSDNWIYNIEMPISHNYRSATSIQIENYIKWINDNIQIQLEKIEPDENDTMVIWLGNPLWDIGPRIFLPERFHYRNRLLDKKTLSLLSGSQLRILRNAFYAFHGYNFKDNNLKLFFQNFSNSWYVINENFNESMFSEIERSNIDSILEEERRR